MAETCKDYLILWKIWLYVQFSANQSFTRSFFVTFLYESSNRKIVYLMAFTSSWWAIAKQLTNDATKLKTIWRTTRVTKPTKMSFNPTKSSQWICSEIKKELTSHQTLVRNKVVFLLIYVTMTQEICKSKAWRGVKVLNIKSKTSSLLARFWVITGRARD